MDNNLKNSDTISDRRETRIYNAHNFFVIGITAIIAIAGFLAYSSLSSFKDETRIEMELYTRNLKSSVDSEIKANLDLVKDQVRARINEEFDRDNIQRMIEQILTQRLDKMADNLITTKIENQIIPKIDELDLRIERIFQETELKLIFLKASNDSRIAFEKLKELSNKSNYQLSLNAKQYYTKIYDENKTPVFFYSLVVPDDRTPKFDDMDLDQIRDLMIQTNKDGRETILNEVWFNEKFDFNSKMTFYQRVMKEDASISVVRAAAQIVINQNKLDFNPMEWEEILSFLDKNF